MLKQFSIDLIPSLADVRFAAKSFDSLFGEGATILVTPSLSPLQRATEIGYDDDSFSH